MNAVSDAIVMSEILGAREFASRFNRMPLRLAKGPIGSDSIDMLARLGFELGEPVEEIHGRPPLFVKVTPPEGWTLVLGQDPVESRIYDADGCERAVVFFKASLHDRRSDLTVHPRYYVTETYLDADGAVAPHRRDPVASRWSVRDRQTGDDLFTADPTPTWSTFKGENDADIDAWADPWQAARDGCKAWLANAYPDTDPTAYWAESPVAAPSGP